MCRNITILRGLDPPATPEEIEAAARQYLRKVTGLGRGALLDGPEFAGAVSAVARVTAELLGALPARRQAPPTDPPLRRLRRDG